MKPENVILLNKIYCWIRGFGWLLFMGMCFWERANIGLVYETGGETLRSLDMGQEKLAFLLGVFALASLFFAVVNFFLASAPMKKHWWTAHLLNHIVGILECCCFPMALPLLIFWMREDVRAMFAGDTLPND
jgi:hypothetical protein